MAADPAVPRFGLCDPVSGGRVRRARAKRMGAGRIARPAPLAAAAVRHVRHRAAPELLRNPRSGQGPGDRRPRAWTGAQGLLGAVRHLDRPLVRRRRLPDHADVEPPVVHRLSAALQSVADGDHRLSGRPARPSGGGGSDLSGMGSGGLAGPVSDPDPLVLGAPVRDHPRPDRRLVQSRPQLRRLPVRLSDRPVRGGASDPDAAALARPDHRPVQLGGLGDLCLGLSRRRQSGRAAQAGDADRLCVGSGGLHRRHPGLRRTMAEPGRPGSALSLGWRLPLLYSAPDRDGRGGL